MLNLTSFENWTAPFISVENVNNISFYFKNWALGAHTRSWLWSRLWSWCCVLNLVRDEKQLIFYGKWVGRMERKSDGKLLILIFGTEHFTSSYSWRSEMQRDVIKMAAIQFQFLFHHHRPPCPPYHIGNNSSRWLLSAGSRPLSCSLSTPALHLHIDVALFACDESSCPWSRRWSWLGRLQVQVEVEVNFCSLHRDFLIKTV